MRIFENSPRKWANSHSQKLFLRNSKIVCYQDILQLPVPLNTLHTIQGIHLNAKSHNLLYEPNSRKYKPQFPMHH